MYFYSVSNKNFRFAIAFPWHFCRYYNPLLTLSLSSAFTKALSCFLLHILGHYKFHSHFSRKHSELSLSSDSAGWGLDSSCVLENILWASLVVQWLRICLPVQGTRVRALVWEDPTCPGATRSVSHNYWACASGACAPQQERPRWWEACAPWWRVAPTCHN